MSEETGAVEQQNTEQAGGEPQASSFDISSLNETLGEGFSFEDVGSLKDRLTGYNELSTQAETWTKEKSEWETKYNELNGKYDSVLSHFTGDDVIDKLYGSKDTWQRVQLEKKFADKDIDAVNRVYNSDLNSMNEMDAILLADKLKYKANISDSDRQSAILNRMGIEDYSGNPNDLDANQRYSLSVEVSKAKEVLSEVKDFQPEEPSFDWMEEAKTSRANYEEKQKSLNEGWTKNITDSLQAYEGTTSLDGEFKYTADDKFKQEVLPRAIQDFVNGGLDPNDKKNQGLLQDYIDQQHKLYAFDKMVKKASEMAATAKEDELHKEIHNDTPTNTNEAPPVTTDTRMTYAEYKASKNK